jgi:hypothetical protein
VDLITIPSDGEREPLQCSDAVELAKHLPLSPRSSFFSSFPPIRKRFFQCTFSVFSYETMDCKSPNTTTDMDFQLRPWPIHNSLADTAGFQFHFSTIYQK